ncbi:hypothetical protein GW17_00052783 [Ensete ventricosum]|nr:hypothetical protein GW17_00052783 [Ensete ventricosum]
MVPEMMQRANHYIAAKTLVADKQEEQKCPRVEQPRGPPSRPSRRRIDGPELQFKKQIDVIVGGPAAGGDSSSMRKAYAHVTAKKTPRQHRCPEITFWPEGEEYPDHDDALVILCGVLPMLLDRDNAPQEASNLTMTIDPREPSKLILNPEPMEEVGEIPVDPK